MVSVWGRFRDVSGGKKKKLEISKSKFGKFEIFKKILKVHSRFKSWTVTDLELPCFRVPVCAASKSRSMSLSRVSVSPLPGSHDTAAPARVLLGQRLRGRIEACTRFAYDLAEETRRQPLGAVTPGYDFMGRLRPGVERLLPPDAHARAHGRLHVSVTPARRRENRLVSAFPSREDLVQVSGVTRARGTRDLRTREKTRQHACTRDDTWSWAHATFTPAWARVARARRPPARATPHPAHACPVSPPQVLLASSTWDRGAGGASRGHVTRDTPRPAPPQLSLANLTRLRHALFPPPRPALEAAFYGGFRDAVRFLRREGWLR
ncbi:patatin-like phospholipase domain-containing protein 4 [Peromyscus californicus insignis]|uniref:patatin-like phospholipase domain-containing protein 4 n=1 Tax=Peromyscus californicus insignis TaxID=564181 RepID=UPI0022A77942|nr:patatin-like phospholipase domain-containing protein 4 [Peromyscus californicus insignis]